MTLRRVIGLLLLVNLFYSDLVRAQDIPSACGNSKVRYRMRGQPGSSFVWTVKGGIRIAQYAAGDSIDVKWDNLAGAHNLTCQEYVSSGCPGPPVTVNVDVITRSLDIGTVAYLCEGQKLTLNAGKGFTQYHWQDGSSGPTLEAVSPGVYWVETRQGKCIFRDSISVVKVPVPVVDLGKDTFLCDPEEMLLDAANPGLLYEWSNGSRSQTIWAKEGDGVIWVKVTDSNNCTSTDSITILPCSIGKLLIPNVFTPNGDGQNDVWRIGGIQYYPDMIVKLFDRWGRLIFESDPGYPKPWNGERNNKLLPMDAYFYIIDLKDGSKPIRGSVTLVP